MRKHVARPRTVLTRMAIVLIVLEMCGCGLIDHFGPRSTHYNYETADSKSATILLNVVRAAYSNPLQFTDVSSVSGTTGISGNLSASTGASIPFPLNALARALPRTATLSPQVSAGGNASGSTVFNVSNLNTQEFYQGLQTPLSMQQIAYYLSGQLNGLTAYELLPLFISDIELVSGSTKYTLHGRAAEPGSFFAFYSAINTLVNNGLTVEPVKQQLPMTVGPVLTEDEVKDPKILAALVSSSGASSNGLTLVSAKNGIKNGYQFQAGGSGATGSYRFCFAQTKYPYSKVDYSVSSPPRDPLVIPLGHANGKPIRNATVAIGREYYCGAKAVKNPTPNHQRQLAGLGIRITTRSLEGIIYFLGEMVRTELGLATDLGASLAIPSPGQPEFRLFSVERRPPSTGEPWVTYHGQIFSIRVDPSGQIDASSRILQLLTDLMALQSSAKNLPAPNLITIATP